MVEIVSQAQDEGVLASDLDPVIPTMTFFAFFNGLNLTYGQEWLNLPGEIIKNGALRLMGAQEN